MRIVRGEWLRHHGDTNRLHRGAREAGKCITQATADSNRGGSQDSEWASEDPHGTGNERTGILVQCLFCLHFSRPHPSPPLPSPRFRIPIDGQEDSEGMNGHLASHMPGAAGRKERWMDGLGGAGVGRQREGTPWRRQPPRRG